MRNLTGQLASGSAGLDLVWAAGFYCGEGTCSPHRNSSGRQYANVTIGNTDYETLERCQRSIGGKIYGPYDPKGPLSKKPYWMLKIGSEAEVSRALDLMWPFLTEEKRNQAQRALDAQASNPPVRKRGWPAGVPRGRTRRGGEPCSRGHDGEHTYEYTDPQGRSAQKCRACQRDKDKQRRSKEKRNDAVAG